MKRVKRINIVMEVENDSGGSMLGNSVEMI